MECMAACSPSYRNLYKPSENGANDGELPLSGTIMCTCFSN